MQLQRALESLGYNHNEITVYLAMMQLGETTVTDVARKTQLPRSTAQLAVHGLQKKGLVTLSMRRNHSIWVAESPSKFLVDIREKEVLLEKIIPALQALRHEAKNKTILKFYGGVDKISAIFEETLQSQYATQVLGSVPHMIKYLGQEIVEDFFEKLFNRTTPVQLLSTTSEFVLGLKKDSKSGQNRVRIYDDDHLTQVVYIIFNTKVVIILLSQTESIGVIFEDKGFAESTQLFFNRLWDDAV